MRLPSAALLVALAGCYEPSFDPCAVHCSAGDLCPGDTSCAGDGFCHHDGEAMCSDAPPLDMAPVVDLAPTVAPTARLGLTAFKNAGSFTPGMSATTFSVSTSSIADGNLVLFVGSIDNGSSTIWPDPVADGFTNIARRYYGPDGQSFVVAWKIADGEPVSYDGTYGDGVGSAAAAIALVVIQGAGEVGTPVVATVATATDPVPAGSFGVTTTAAHSLIVSIAGVDWTAQSGFAEVAAPSGYTELVSVGDHGDAGFDWTSLEIATTEQAVAGSTGPLETVFDSATNAGAGFTVVLAIPPAS